LKDPDPDPEQDPDPDPYLWLVDPDPDPGGPKTCGSGGSGGVPYILYEAATEFNFFSLKLYGIF
jgi:hypothetical protein